MTLRPHFDRHYRLIETGDLDGLLGQYHEDAVVLRFDRVYSGHEEIRALLNAHLAQRPRLVEVLRYAECEDVISYQAVVALGDDEDRRLHGTLVLRGERIVRQVVGTFPAAGTAARKGAVQIDLDPYDAWVARAVPDPRSAGREAIGPVLLEIVNAEGPMLAGRAYRLYVRASGGKALTSVARAPLSGAAYRLRMAGAIVMEEAGSADEAVLRPAGTPPVVVRELGPRALDEVPSEEIAELMRRLLAAGVDGAELPRAVLDQYGLVRMTAKAEDYLSRARERALAQADPG